MKEILAPIETGPSPDAHPSKRLAAHFDGTMRIKLSENNSCVWQQFIQGQYETVSQGIVPIFYLEDPVYVWTDLEEDSLLWLKTKDGSKAPYQDSYLARQWAKLPRSDFSKAREGLEWKFPKFEPSQLEGDTTWGFDLWLGEEPRSGEGEFFSFSFRQDSGRLFDPEMIISRTKPNRPRKKYNFQASWQSERT